MNYIFFDLSSELLCRYPNWLSRKLNPDNNIIFLSLECDAWKTIFNKNIEGFSYDALVIFGHRLPDLVLAMVAKKNGKKVIYFQHGFFKPRLERSLFSFIDLVRKKLHSYLKVFCFAVTKGFIKPASLYYIVLAAFYNNSYVGKLFNSFCPKCIDIALIFKKDDLDMFDQIFLGNVSRYQIIGDPNIERFSVTKSPDFDVIFFAQTFVEDGRLEKDFYQERLCNFVSALSVDCRYAIFLHQRSDVNIYTEIGLIDKLIFPRWDIPSANIYLSDYSSLLITALDAGFNVSRVNLSDHNVPLTLSEIPMFPEFIFKAVAPRTSYTFFQDLK